MSKVIVVNPPGLKYIRARGDNWPSAGDENVAYTAFPYLLGTCAAALEKRGHEVEFIDCVAEKLSRNDFTKRIKAFSPKLIIALTSTTSYFYDIETIKKINLLIPIVAVGVHATAISRKHLEDGFDYVLRGEFENSSVYLLENLNQYSKLEKFKGICFKDKNDIFISEFSETVKDLNELPFPAYHLMKMDLYSEPFAKGKHIMMLTTRGCPYRCSYCSVPYFYGGSIYRKRNPRKVVDEIEYLVEKFKIDEVYFDDSSITVDKNHLLELAKEIKNRNLGITWSCMGNVHIKDEVIEELATSGCRGLKIGIETGDASVLGHISKKIKTEDIIRVIKKCQKLGMKVHGTYMIGLPHETKEKAQETIDFMLKVNTNTCQIAIATPFPGTKFYDEAKEKGWLITEDWSKFDGNHAVLSYPQFSSKEIKEMCTLAISKWIRHVAFTRPSTILHHLSGIYKRKGFFEMLSGIKYGISLLFKSDV